MDHGALVLIETRRAHPRDRPAQPHSRRWWGISPIPLILIGGLAFGEGGSVPVLPGRGVHRDRRRDRRHPAPADARPGVHRAGAGRQPEGLADRRPDRHAAQRRAGRADRAAAGMGAGRRGGDGGHHVGVLLRRHRQGAAGPRPPHQPRDPGRPVHPRHRGLRDGVLSARPDRAADRHEPASPARSPSSSPWWRSCSSSTSRCVTAGSCRGWSGRRRPTCCCCRCSASDCWSPASPPERTSRRRWARSWSASRSPGPRPSTRSGCSRRCATCSPRCSSCSSASPPTPRDLVPMLVPAILLAIVTMGTKLLTGYIAGRRAGIGEAGRWRAGFALMPRGEFSIVIAGLAVAAGVDRSLGRAGHRLRADHDDRRAAAGPHPRRPQRFKAATARMQANRRARQAA